jgi:hypothetical protein
MKSAFQRGSTTSRSGVLPSRTRVFVMVADSVFLGTLLALGSLKVQSSPRLKGQFRGWPVGRSLLPHRPRTRPNCISCRIRVGCAEDEPGSRCAGEDRQGLQCFLPPLTAEPVVGPRWSCRARGRLSGSVEQPGPESRARTAHLRRQRLRTDRQLGLID